MGFYITLCTVHTTEGQGQGQVTIITARKRSLGQGNIFRSVCQEVCAPGGEGGAIPACIAEGIPAWFAAGLGGGGGIPACLAGFQAYTQRRSWVGSGQGGISSLTLGGSAPRGGACSRGCLLWGCVWWDPPMTATAVGSTHPTGMHSCFLLCLPWSLSHSPSRAVCISHYILTCSLLHSRFGQRQTWIWVYVCPGSCTVHPKWFTTQPMGTLFVYPPLWVLQYWGA